ncbi:MAG: hypothetical protein AAF108_06005 [Planctomycetota bacterium]
MRMNRDAAWMLAIGITAGSAQAQPERASLLQQARLDQAELQNVATSAPPFSWRGADGRELNLNGQIQFRYVGNLRRGDVDNYTGGFDHRRTRLNVSAKLPGGRVGFVLIRQFSSTSGLDGVLDQYVTLDLGGGWRARAGTFLLPFDREFMVSNKKRLVNDLSLVGQAVGANLINGRSDGVQVDWSSDRWKWQVALTDGVGAFSRSFAANAIGRSADVALTSRVDWLVFGDFASFDDEAAFSGGEEGLMLGAAIHGEKREIDADQDGAFDDQVEDLRWTVDAVYERPVGAGGVLDGTFASLQAFGRHQFIEGVDNEERFGVIAQYGKNLSDETQLFTRYEWATDDDGGADLSQITLGWTEFFRGNNFRLTTELLYAFEPVTANFASPIRDLVVDAPNERGQAGIRTQIQLVF